MLVALAVDHWLGEPPVRWHPVVWMGNALVRYAEWVSPIRGVLSAGDRRLDGVHAWRLDVGCVGVGGCGDRLGRAVGRSEQRLAG